MTQKYTEIISLQKGWKMFFRKRTSGRKKSPRALAVQKAVTIYYTQGFFFSKRRILRACARTRIHYIQMGVF